MVIFLIGAILSYSFYEYHVFLSGFKYSNAESLFSPLFMAFAGLAIYFNGQIALFRRAN